ncbi:hypothetical protein [Fervidibacter sacchari]
MTAAHRLKLLAIVLAVILSLRMCAQYVSKKMEVIEKESMMELVSVWYQLEYQTESSDRKYGGVGIVIAENKVLTSARAIGWVSRDGTWDFIGDKLIKFPDSLHDPDFKPVRWFVEAGSGEFNAYPVLLMPKGYDIAVLHVEGLRAWHYPRIVDDRLKDGDFVRVLRISFVPRRNGKVRNEYVDIAKIVNSEVKYTRRFRYGWNRVEVPVTLVLAEAPCESVFLAPSMPSGAPVFNDDGLCGIVPESWVHEEENKRGLVYTWIEPLNEVKREIETALTRK